MKYYKSTVPVSACLIFLLFFQAAPHADVPQETCYDKFAWKYEDYTTKPLAANQLLAAAYTIYVDFSANDKMKPDEQSAAVNTIVGGFHTAMTNWTASLIYNRSELAPELKKYIADHTFNDGNKQVWNPPQVLAVKCPQDANFIVKVFLPGGKKYAEKTVVAQAQIKGRTITLNMQNFQLFFRNGFFELKDDKGMLNIVPVIAHELGHSFGLNHVSVDNSIMNGSYHDLGRFPSVKDGKLFASILLQTVQPKSPGYFNPTECAGLKSD